MHFIRLHYPKILFLICLVLALFSVIRSEIYYTQKVKHVDYEFLQQKSIATSTLIQVDSDVTHTVSQSVFFAHNIQTQERYKINTKPLTDIHFGDCLKVSGLLSVPQVNTRDENTTLYNFPYREYLAKDNIYYILNIKNFSLVQECENISQYSRVRLFFMKKKEKLTSIFLTRYEQPYAGLVAGVLVAGKGLLDKESLELFKRTSLSHVVVLSGSNVSIILVCIKLFVDLLFFWKKDKGKYVLLVQKIIILFSVWMFMLLTGGGAPIYRAVASAYCGMILFGEKNSQVYSLTVTILILTALSPFQTLYDPSFHLTCCATYGLILFSKPIDIFIRLSNLRFIPTWLREIVSVTLATQVFVFPYIIFMTSSFSSVFLLSNILVLPLIPIIMLLGFITLLADLLSIYFLLQISIYINNIFLHIIFYVVKVFANVPYGYIQITKTTSMFVLVVYVFIFSIIVIFCSRRRS